MSQIKKDFPLVFQNIFYDWNNNVIINPIETQNYTIVQIADGYQLNKFLTPDHIQICDMEIVYVVFNSINCAVNGTELTVPNKSVHIAFKDETHRLSSKNATRHITIAFNVKPDSPSREIFESIRAQRIDPDNRVVNADPVQSQITAIVSEMVETKSYRENFLDSLITELLVYLARPYSEQVLHHRQNIRALLPEIANYIENNFKTIISVEEICNYFGYSHVYICKYFKKYYNMTMKEYILKNKMEYAKKLLDECYSVSQVSDMLNCSSPYNFSKAYKAYFGHSPTK